MAKKRMKKLLASALAVSMAATLLPAAVMAGPNEEVILENAVLEQQATTGTLLNNVLKAKAPSRDMENQAEVTSFNANMNAIEDVEFAGGTAKVYANKEKIVSYAGSTGQTLPFFALVLDCAESVSAVKASASGNNALGDDDEWPMCHSGHYEMAGLSENETGKNYISLWCLKTWWDEGERADANGSVNLVVSGNGASEDLAITFEDATIDITGTKSVAISGNTTLVASTRPTSASAKVIWNSEDEDIATVDTSGKVTGVASGNATITATMASGVVSSCQVEVTERAPEPTDEPEPTKPGEMNTPAVTPDPSGTPDPSVTPDPSETPDPSVTPDPSGTPAPTGAPDPSGTPAPTNTPEPTPTEPVKKGDEVETKAGTVVVTNPSSKTVAFDTVDDSATTVTVPKTVKIDGVTYEVTTIKASAFADSKKLTAVTIPSTITAIGKNAFAGCSKLTKVTVKSTNLKALKENTFKDCKALTSVSLPKSVTSIGKNVFAGCSKLKSITLKATNLKVKKGAFKGIAKNAVIKVPKSKVKAYTKLLKKAGFKGKVKAI